MTSAELLDSVKRAGQLDPTNKDVANWSMTVAAMSENFKLPGRDVKTTEMLVGNALLSEAWGNYATEVKEMEMAKALPPAISMSLRSWTTPAIWRESFRSITPCTRRRASPNCLRGPPPRPTETCCTKEMNGESHEESQIGRAHV